jgi:cell division septum initiation protein DivIVA
MLEQVKKLHSMTLTISDIIDQTDVDQLLDLVEFREKVIKSLQSCNEPVPEEIQFMLREIQYCNDIIVGRIRELMEEAAAGLQSFNRFSQQKKVYEQAYTANSYFVDKRN